jgi:hypothetical protein
LSVAEPFLRAMRLQRDSTFTSPLYRALLQTVVEDAETGGVTDEVLSQTDPTLDPVADALTLRFLGGLHRLVLEGKAPDLARFYPSVGGRYDTDTSASELRGVLLATIADHRDELLTAMTLGVQTNEVGRCAALLLGFLAVAREASPKLRVLEIGASAGLNLRWDRFRYEGGAGGSAWGDPASPLRFAGVYADPAPELDAVAEVVERAGCDRSPIDATSDDGRSLLRSFVWPDQLERFAALDAALAVAATTPAHVERADAAEWLESRLRERPADDGIATVVYHSVVWQYLPRATQERMRATFDAAGAQATRDAPLAWLRMEPAEDPNRAAEIRLRVWPGGEDRLLARSGFHGRPIRARAG